MTQHPFPTIADAPPQALAPDDIAHRPGAAGLVRNVLTADARDEAEALANTPPWTEPDPLPISDAVLSGEPPDDIEADIAGLPPMRARLVRFTAWIAAKRAEREQKEAGRHAFLRDMGAPAVTAAAIDELVASEKTGWLKHILSLGSTPAAAPPPTRAYEREQLISRMQGEQYQREVALAGYDEVVRQIALLDDEIGMLESRKPAFVRDAVEERGDAELAQRYIEAIRTLADVTRQAAGLGVALGPGSMFRDPYAPDDIAINLPWFHFKSAPWHRGPMVQLDAPRRPALKVSQAEAKAASALYAELKKLWASDPRAEMKEPAQ